MPSLKLTYFDAPGRAEPIRVALHIAGLPFDDHRVQFPEFMELKRSGALPLGALPVLETDGLVFPQTAAILRYVAHLGAPDLYPTDPTDALIVDSTLDTFNDTLSHALTPSLFEKDMEKKLAMRKAIAEGPMALAFGYAERMLARSGGPFLCGATLSIADLVLAQQVLQIRDGRLDGITADHLAPYPGLLALADAYLADPRIEAYRASRA
jgi:glutathione S-transferase